MTAFVVILREGPVAKEAALEAYRNVPINDVTRPADMTPLAYYGSIQALEGLAPDGIVIFAFPDLEAARAWYFSPQYQARVPLRRQAAPYRAFIVDGVKGR